MQIAIPDKVCYIIDELENRGFEAYAVGGCVRDSILRRNPKDWDITTPAKPKQIKEIFKRTIDTGIQHGTVTVMLGESGYEVTTYRIDGEYMDSRHPEVVEFTGSLEEDLKRRDFTINAMAYNPKTGLVDLFNGIDDLNNKCIRCVGNPTQRFNEDALRMLRAVRFCAQLKFEIEKQTAAAIKVNAESLKKISAERIQMELTALLVSDNPGRIKTAQELGITKVILPEYDAIVGVSQITPNHIYTVDEHTIKSMECIDPDTVLRLTMLMHDFGKPAVKKTLENGRDIFYRHPEISVVLAKEILKRLKFDNDTTQKVLRLIKWHGLKYSDDYVSVRRALNRVGDDIFLEFIQVQIADVMAKNPTVIPMKLNALYKKKVLFDHIIEEGQCFRVSGLKINGRDLMNMGINQGPIIGHILERLTEMVIDDQRLNTKENLRELALKVKDDPTIFDEKKYFFE